MRRLFSFVLLLSSSVAFADQATTFGDLFFFPNKGEKTYSNRTFRKENKFTDKTTNAAGAVSETAKKDNIRIVMEQKATYSFSDYFYVGAGIDVAFRNRTFYKARTGSNGQDMDAPVIQANGWTEPYFYAAYRLLKQNENKFNLDFGLLYSPQLLDAKNPQVSGTSSTEGDYARGTDELTLEVKAGKTFNLLEALAYIKFTRFFEGKRRYMDTDRTGDYMTIEAQNNFAFGFNTLYKLHYRWLVGASADYLFVDEASVGGRKHSTQQPFNEGTTDYMVQTYGVEARFVWLRDLYFYTGYNYSLTGDREMTTSNNNAVSQRNKYSDDSAHTYIIGAVAKF